MKFYILIFMINWGCNILFLEMFCLSKISKLLKKDEARDSLYPAFRRNDLKWINRTWLWATCHFTLVRFMFAFAIIFL